MFKSTMGFLFDVDGTLTFYRGDDSAIDQQIIADLNLIRQKGIPIGLVTGRSVDWVRNYFFSHVNNPSKEYIRIFGEFGLVSWDGKEKILSEMDNETNNALETVKKRVFKTFAKELGLKPIISYSAPKQKCLWVEPKDLMGTFRTLPSFDITIDFLLEIVKPIVDGYSSLLKIESNPAAADVLPIWVSKQFGAEKAIESLDPKGRIQKWFAFGDSEADREMSKARNGEVEFFLVPRANTNKVHKLIQELLKKYES